MADSTKRRPGAPSKYKPAFKEEIVSLMAQGFSLTAAASDIGVHRDTVYHWEATIPEFSDAIKLARGKRQMFLERRLYSAKAGHVVTSSIFALKNAAPKDWSDKQEVDHSSSDGSMTPTAFILAPLKVADDDPGED